MAGFPMCPNHNYSLNQSDGVCPWCIIEDLEAVIKESNEKISSAIKIAKASSPKKKVG